MRIQDIDPEMINLMQTMAELGSLKTRIEDDKISPYMTITEAKEKYGAANVKFWRDKGLIQVLKDGNRNAKTRIDRFRIAVVAKQSNRGL
jgi:hypothetical protein